MLVEAATGVGEAMVEAAVVERGKKSLHGDLS
jgi:hypothetical protein